MATLEQDAIVKPTPSASNIHFSKYADAKHMTEQQEINESEDELENVDLSVPQFTYERDFCFKVALILAPEYTSTTKIKELIAHIYTISQMDKMPKRILISLTIQLYNEVYKNNLLKTQMKSVFDRYKQEAENQGYQNKHAIELACIKAFEKMPPAQDLILQIHDEFLSIFKEMDDKTFSGFVQLFLRGNFIDSVNQSALYIIRFPETIMSPEDHETIQETAVASAAQHIVFAIESIRHALADIFETRQYSILTAPITADDKQKNKPKKEPTSQIKITSAKDINPFFISYLTEILQDQSHSAALNSGGSLVKDQFIRIPNLIQAMKQIHAPATSAPPAELTRSALSIIQRLDLAPNSNDNLDFHSTTEKMLIVSTRFGRKKHCHFTQHEEFAALLDRFPLVEGLNDGGAIRASSLKCFKLYPGTTESFGPHLIWIELGTTLLGAATATYGILHPKQNPMPARFWRASTNGVVFFVFSLGAAINIYLWFNPNQQNISEALFFEEIASGPLVLMALHTVWNTIPPLQKEIFFPRKTCFYALRLSFDIGSKSLYNAGVFLFAALTFFNLPKTLLYQLLPIIPGGIVALGQIFSSFKEKLNTGMTYITFSVFASNMIKGALPSSNERSFESNWHIILRSSVLTGLGIYSFALLTRNYLQFLREYVNEDNNAAEIIARKIRLRMKNGELDTTAFQNQGLIIDMNEYHRLEEDMTQGRVEEARRKTLVFSNNALQLQQQRCTDRQNHQQTNHHNNHKQDVISENAKSSTETQQKRKKSASFCSRLSCVVM